MKFLLVISVAVACLSFASCSGNSQQKKTDNESTIDTAVDSDLKKELIAGKVDSIRQRVYWCLEKFGRMEKGKLQNLPVHDFLKVYNKAGFLIEETHYNVNSEVVNSRKITYNADNLPASEELFKGVELSERIVYTYNEKNSLAKKEKFDGYGKSRERTEYSYYNDSYLLMDEDLYKDGKLSVKYVYIYENSQLTKKHKYWGGGSLAQAESYKYDYDNHLASVFSETYKDKIAKFEKHIEYGEYTRFGEYGIKIEYDANGSQTAKITRTYDDFGNLTSYVPAALKQVADETDETEVNVEIRGEDIEYEEYEETTPKQEWVSSPGDAYEYTYDDKNNWIQKITYKITENGERVRQFYFDRVIYYK
ncbi:MAG: hypothetical protein LBH32_04575 [Dysgonamonadaceae bacterium]|jgi:hypothetical protein|nr:hypothetical protein [Dysgonamonadaceae bacterium]